MRRMKRAMAGLLSMLMLVQATGCSSWKAVSLSVAVVEDPKNKVQVVLKEGGTVTSDSVRAKGDSVVTYQAAGMGTIPLTRVKEVKVHRSNPGATGVLLLGIGAALYAVFGAMVRAAD